MIHEGESRIAQLERLGSVARTEAIALRKRVVELEDVVESLRQALCAMQPRATNAELDRYADTRSA